MPPMELERDKSGLWMYRRDPWIGGPPVDRNGCPPGIVTQEDAERVINQLYPGSFPDRETADREDAAARMAAAMRGEPVVDEPPPEGSPI